MNDFANTCSYYLHYSVIDQNNSFPPSVPLFLSLYGAGSTIASNKCKAAKKSGYRGSVQVTKPLEADSPLVKLRLK